ncbi:hypothetical protein LRH25_22645 [Ideonella azotifigens]|uniref:Uncharacterized protein n=1 Tax=Ideonella azotifigens TaxID=513160 RepID=A0ABN1KD82_9BURK|nr:hypothetical protein [Ideonella azotifigens]MCD2343130.1 hypothetical protein [Ideonella azotifigens]
MSVSVAGRPVQQPGSLSDLGRLALAFVDGGLEWFAWAMASTAVRYDFPDETTLLAQVQLGLHGSPLALLPVLTLLASPVKLMSLGLADLRVLAKAEGGDDNALLATQMRRVCTEHQLLNQAELTAPQAWLGKLGVASAPVFQAMDFLDRVALVRLMNDPLLAAGDNAITTEAAAFAVQQARTPLEFADYLGFYQALAAQPGAPQSPELRATQAEDAKNTLLPLFFGALDCPQVNGLPSPAEVGQAVGAWLSSGKQVGFSRLSEGLMQIVRHTRFQGQTGDAARRLVDAYLASAQSLLAAARPHQARMGQDGHTCLYRLASGEQQAELLLSGNGVISLREFGLRSPPAAPRPPLAPLEPENP